MNSGFSGPSLRFAYLFWFASWFGFAGLHRFYLGRPVSGLIYLLTWGLGGIGTIYDGFVMPSHVRRARLEYRLDAALDRDLLSDGDRPRERRESIEHAILRLAQDGGGLVSPGRLALDTHISVDEAKAQLEKLVDARIADIRATQSGIVVYVLPEFLTDAGRVQLEEI